MGESIALNVARTLGTSRVSAAVSYAKLWLLAVAVFLVLVPGASAQLYTGSVSGVVLDPSGAALPGARVALVDSEKGFAYEVKTDQQGRYILREIPPGTYTLTVEAPNFEIQRRERIRLDVNQNISFDFSMKIGATSEIVNVEASGVHLETEDAVTGQVVDRKLINDLPLVDRNTLDLAFLAPGVVPTNIPSAIHGNINFNSNGSRNMTADVLVDGASATNFEQNSGIQNLIYQPSVDAVQEFKVQQSNFSAEYGFAGATIVNAITRSGTNSFHGGLYEFWRNQILDANEWFNKANGNSIPALRKNDFGGTIGGPIKKDKTFFFFDYEGLRTRSFTSNAFGVPTLCERGDASAVCPALAQQGISSPVLGDFEEICTLQGFSFDSTGRCSDPSGQLWDPFSGKYNDNSNPANPEPYGPGSQRQAFIPFNNLAGYTSSGAGLPSGPGNLIDPLAKNLLLLFPKPNLPINVLSDAQTNDFFVSGTNPSSNNQFDIKIDHRFTEKNLLSGKYSQRTGNSNNLNCFGNFADPCAGSGPTTSSAHLLALNFTRTISATLLFNITYGYTRAFDFSHGIGADYSNFASDIQQLGVPSYLEQSGFLAVPYINMTNGNYSTTIGGTPFSILREGQDVHNVGGSLGWVKGKHDLKFGGELRVHRINFVQPGWPAGEFDFGNTGTSEFANAGDYVQGGDDLASFLIGVGPPLNGGTPGGCTPCFRGFDNFVSTQSIRWAAFVQDNYRVTPKLTLNLGIRYELSLPRTERYNRMNSLDPNIVSPIQYAQPPVITNPLPGLTPVSTLHGAEVFTSPNDRSNYDTFYKSVQPRFGFAYQLPHATVVRGGYGIYFDAPRSGASGTGPWGFEGFDTQPPWVTTVQSVNAGDQIPCCRLNNPAPNGVPQPPGSLYGTSNDLGFAAVGPVKSISKNIPYEQAWSFGLQKELPGKILVDTSYIGKKGTHLYLGGFREMDFLGPAFDQEVLSGQLTQGPAGDIANLPITDQPNPFYSLTCTPTTDPRNPNFICNPDSALSQPMISRYQLYLPYPQFAGFQGDSPPIADSIYHAFQLRVERSFANGLEFLLTYTFSKSIDTASATDDSISWLGGGTTGGSTIGVQDPNNLRAERAVSVFDIPQVLQFSYVYELPFGRGKPVLGDSNPVVNAIVGGWQTSATWRFDNGRPILPSQSNGQAIPTYGLRPSLSAPLERASGSPEGHVNLSGCTCSSYFANSSAANPGVLTPTLDFTLGTAPRTIASVRQPGTRLADMSLFKEIPMGALHEGMRLEFRAEAFNVFNHPQFAGPNANVSSSTFGLIRSTISGPRELQLGLKLYF
jgi:hypothetical protein